MFDRIRKLWAQEIQQKANDSRPYISASLSPLDKLHDGKPQPFSNAGAVKHFSSWIYAAATINGNAVASTPLRLYVRNNRGRSKLWSTRKVDHRTKRYMLGDGRVNPSVTVMRKAAELGTDYEEVTDNHPLLNLLSRSNPFINGYDLTVLRVVWQELTGNAYLHIVTNPAMQVPTELWPMPPQWTRVLPDEQQFLRGYLYGRSETTTEEFSADEVIHFKRPNPSDLYYGMGKLQAAWGAAEANVALHEMDLSWFANKARPDYALVIRGNASEDSIDALEKQIQSKLRGSRKTGHFLVTTADLDLKPLQFSPKDMQGRAEVVEEIAAVFGVPVSMLKANDPNLASAEAGFASWREMTVLPLCRMDEETLNQRLLPLFGLEDDAVLAYDNPVPANRVQDLTERQAAVATGWMTANEARELYGLERIDSDPHADMLHVNGQPLGGIPAAPAMGPLGASLAPAIVQDAISQPATTQAASEAPAAPEAMKAQHVREASDVLAKVKDAAIAPAAAVELLAALGFDRGTAQGMVDAQQPASGKGAAPAPALVDKAVEDIDTVPPQQVQDNAARALAVRAEAPPSQRGMTEVGIARARDLSNGVALSEDTVRRMVAYFERHEVDKQGETWDEQGAGWQAWYGWGGDEGWAWSKRKVEEFDRAREAKSTPAVATKGAACGCDNHDKAVRASDLWTKADTGPLVDDELLNGWLKGVDKVLRKQVRAVVDALKASGGAPNAEMLDKVLGVLRSTRWDAELVDAMQPYLARSLQHGADLGGKAVAELAKSPAAAQLGWSSSELDRYVERASVRLATRAVDGVNATTEVQLRDLMGSGMQEGETASELANRVQTWADGDKEGESMTRKRALMIARTESARAASTAEQDAWRSTGLVTGKRWLLAPDPCEFCAAAAKSFGKKGVGIDEPFYAKGDTISAGKAGSLTLDYEDVQGPPLHPHCRCAVQPVLDDNFEDIAAEAERRIAGGKAKEIKV